MDYLDTFTEAPASSPSSLFTTMLPLEIRLEIYRYLLKSQYTKREIDTKSKEYFEDRDAILDGPDHSYEFHPAILGANQQIRREAMDIFQRENTFVSLKHSMTGKFFEDYLDLLNVRGVAVLARGTKARAFPMIAMKIKMAVRCDQTEPGIYFSKEAAYQIFTVEDLPDACIHIQNLINRTNHGPKRVHFRVSISTELAIIEPLGDDERPVPGSKMSRCLEPLRQIRQAGRAFIHSPASKSYMYDIMGATCDRRRSVKETMDLAATDFDRGDHHYHTNCHRSAIADYKAALRTIRRGNSVKPGVDERMVGGRFDGLTASRAFYDAIVQLHTQIAAAFLQLGKHRLARIYVERIYRPLATYNDEWGFWMKFPLHITTGEAKLRTPAVYAKLLAVAAQISLVHGQIKNAWEELAEATSFDPLDKNIEQQHDAVESRERDREYHREKRRALKQSEQFRSHQRRLRGLIKVAHRRTFQGDEVLREHDFELARQKYEAAYEKLSNVPVNDCQIKWEWKNLRLKVISQLIVVALELQDHKAVHRWADLSICKDLRRPNWRRPDLRKPHTFKDYHVDSVEYAFHKSYALESAYVAHYGKAVTFQKQGNITAAIREFKWAMRRDVPCHATYYQLERLQLLETEEDKEQDRRDQQHEMEEGAEKGEGAEEGDGQDSENGET